MRLCMDARKSLRLCGHAQPSMLRTLGAKGEPKLLHGMARGVVVGNTRARASPGVQNRRVVAPTEVTADGRQRLARQLTGKIHGHLARPGDTGSPGGGEELLA